MLRSLNINWTFTPAAAVLPGPSEGDYPLRGLPRGEEFWGDRVFPWEVEYGGSLIAGTYSAVAYRGAGTSFDRSRDIMRRAAS
ncbi:hypothetical protein QFZ97_005566 [Paraburkholderia youngii]